MASITDFQSDTNAELNGVWIPIHDGLELLIARADNINFTQKLRDLGSPHKTAVRMRNMDLKVAADLAKKAMASTILLGWKNLTEADQKTPIVYSEQKAFDLLTENTDFFELVFELSRDRANFVRRENEEALGNSDAASSGN